MKHKKRKRISQMNSEEFDAYIDKKNTVAIILSSIGSVLSLAAMVISVIVRSLS